MNITRLVPRPMRLIGAVAGTLVVASLVSGGVATSSAAYYPRATLDYTQTLTRTPTVAMQGRCIERSIDLRQGTYRWETYLYGASDVGALVQRYIVLDAGTYRWHTCITPYNGKYNVDTFLQKKGSGMAFQLAVAQMSGSGTVQATWGSALFKVCCE